MAEESEESPPAAGFGPVGIGLRRRIGDWPYLSLPTRG